MSSGLLPWTARDSEFARARVCGRQIHVVGFFSKLIQTVFQFVESGAVFRIRSKIMSFVRIGLEIEQLIRLRLLPEVDEPPLMGSDAAIHADAVHSRIFEIFVEE